MLQTEDASHSFTLISFSTFFFPRRKSPCCWRFFSRFSFSSFSSLIRSNIRFFFSEV